jgi:hypothetical protein
MTYSLTVRLNGLLRLSPVGSIAHAPHTLRTRFAHASHTCVPVRSKHICFLRNHAHHALLTLIVCPCYLTQSVVCPCYLTQSVGSGACA